MPTKYTPDPTTQSLMYLLIQRLDSSSDTKVDEMVDAMIDAMVGELRP